MKRSKKLAVSLLFCLVPAILSTAALFGVDHKVRRVLVISFDGMHALDLALWTKNNPNSALAKLAAQGVNFTNASSTKPSDSIPATVGIFTGASPAAGACIMTTLTTAAGSLRRTRLAPALPAR